METGIKQIGDGHAPTLAGISLGHTVWAILAKFTSTFGNLGSEHQAGTMKGTWGGFERSRDRSAGAPRSLQLQR